MEKTLAKQTLNGQVALVTGGGRGIGAVISKHLAEAGAKVALVGRNAKTIQDCANSIGHNAISVTGDVTDAEAMKAAVAQTEELLGPIDLLVNNAGVTGTAGNIVDVDPAAWWRTQEVNVLGALLACQAVLPSMLARGQGRIVHMGSLAGNTPGPGVTDYSVSKTALLRLNESLASEIGDSGLLSIAVSPGWVWTEMTEHFDAVFRDMNDEWNGMDKSAVFPPEAVAELIVRIAAGEADALNGRFIHVKDELATLLANLDRIKSEELLLLRLNML